MISQLGRCRAASCAAALAIAAVREKFPAEMAPTPRSRAAASIASKSAAVSPDVPMTTAAPRPTASSAFALATSWDVKSTSTSTPSSASLTLAYTGAPRHSPPADERLTADRSSMSSAAATASAIADPVQPVAPATHTRRFDMRANDGVPRMCDDSRVLTAREGFYDEMLEADGTPRAHARTLVHALEALGPEALAQAGRRRDAIFMQQGITFDAAGPDADGPVRDRPFPLDLVPRIIPAAAWTSIKRGLAQRIRALNAFIDDVYHGREIVH